MLYLRIHMHVCILPSPIYAQICTACARIGMRILRLVGSLKLWVSFAEYSLFYRALLQKRPLILRSLLIIATLYARCAYPPRLYMHAYICRYRIICITHTYTCSHYRTTFTLCMLIYIYTYSIMYVWLPVYANDYLYMHIDRKNLPPPGGFLSINMITCICTYSFIYLAHAYIFLYSIMYVMHTCLCTHLIDTCM